MVFRAYIDDSYSPGGEFVLAGQIATTENWARFSKDWEALLPSGGTLAPNGGYHFKMKEMAVSADRMARAPAFGGSLKSTWSCIFRAELTLANCLVRGRELLPRRKCKLIGAFGTAHT